LFKKILIANRGEIAVRIARTVRELGIFSAAVYTDADRGALHPRRADEAYALGPNPRAYLDAERLLDVAIKGGCDAVHPGYGFLSENADFAERAEARGVKFIGPSPTAIRAMGSKERARAAMDTAGVPIVPGGQARTDEEARATAERIGYPVMIKAVDGGGGKGMRLVRSEAELASALERTRSEAEKAFGSGAVYIERALFGARHVEVQVLGDRHGAVAHLGERDCSLQRRHQKILEETPCPVLDPATRDALCEVALKGARSLGYDSAGTFEFLLDPSGAFYFLEMNTRLQVEHPVTELVTGVDLVREMIQVASGAPLSPLPPARGAAIEVRLCAEDPARRFAPSPGKVTLFRPPGGPGVRNDEGVASGDTIGPDYDPLLAKLSVWAPDRERALERLRRALDEYVVAGLTTNLEFLGQLARMPEVQSGQYDIGLVERRVDELTALGTLKPDRFEATVAAAAVASLHVGTNATQPEQSDDALSPWVLAERLGRSGRFER